MMYATDLEEEKRQEADLFKRAEEFRRAIHPIVCLPLMRIPTPPEKGTKYLPEVWRPNG